MNLTRAFNMLLIILLFGAILAMNGCSKTDANGMTVGQKIDKAIDQTSATVNDASSRIATSATDAGAAITDTGKKIEERANQSADQAATSVGDALEDASNSARGKAKVAGTVVDDSLITASIKADILKERGLNSLHVEVSTVNGEVTLKGDVDNDASRLRAAQLAMAVPGVAKVNNLLMVAPKHARQQSAGNATDNDGFPLTLARMRTMT